jgi:hypothetical protein
VSIALCKIDVAGAWGKFVDNWGVAPGIRNSPIRESIPFRPHSLIVPGFFWWRRFDMREVSRTADCQIGRHCRDAAESGALRRSCGADGCHTWRVVEDRDNTVSRRKCGLAKYSLAADAGWLLDIGLGNYQQPRRPADVSSTVRRIVTMMVPSCPAPRSEPVVAVVIGCRELLG